MVAKVYKYIKVHETPNGLVGEPHYSEHRILREEANDMTAEEGLMGLLYRGRVSIMFTIPDDAVELDPDA